MFVALDEPLKEIIERCDETSKTRTVVLEFLNEWDIIYLSRAKEIFLFDQTKTSKWNTSQQQFFVKTLYHVRGHFHDVLWYLGNFAPNEELKKIILKNVADEFNGNAFSHEQLYLRLGKSIGVDVSNEFLDEESYLPFIRAFNKTHLEWMKNHSWQDNYAFFAALERLDNVDYRFGKQIAESIGVKDRALAFFNIHINADHYMSVEKLLVDLWQQDPFIVKQAFEFVGNHQLKMWKDLSDAIFAVN